MRVSKADLESRIAWAERAQQGVAPATARAACVERSPRFGAAVASALLLPSRIALMGRLAAVVRPLPPLPGLRKD